jgi:hypothetical protein
MYNNEGIALGFSLLRPFGPNASKGVSISSLALRRTPDASA